MCVLFVLKECSSRIMTEWWAHEVPSRLLLFFDVIRICIDVFEYSPKAAKSGGSQTARNNVTTILTIT
jgi:hypothetical protein